MDALQYRSSTVTTNTTSSSTLSGARMHGADAPAEEAKFYFPELDGLRFIAFLLVFIHHAPALGLPTLSFVKSFGWIGVDLFFALSAFLFVKLLAKEWRKTGSISVRKFYIRRGLRIYPLYVMFCLAIMILSGILGRGEFPAGRAIGLLSFTDNFFAAFAGYNPLPFAAHLWTISYEEQFYLVIPLLLLLLFRSSRSRVVTLLSAGALAFSVVRAVLIHFRTPHPAIWVLPVTHFESILLGVVIGLGGFDVILSRVPALLVLSAGLSSAWLMTRLGSLEAIGWKLMLVYPLIGLSTSLMVYLTFRTGKTRQMRWLSLAPVVYLGKVSYGLYVFHFLGLALGQRVIQHLRGRTPIAFENVVVFLVSLSITIAIASGSYLFIEKPFLKLKRRFEVVASRPA